MHAYVNLFLFTHWIAGCIFQVNIADLLTLSQLANLAATPSQLKSKADVMKIMAVINPGDFGAFFDEVSPAIKVTIIVFLIKLGNFPQEINYTQLNSKAVFFQVNAEMV